MCITSLLRTPNYFKLYFKYNLPYHKPKPHMIWPLPVSQFFFFFFFKMYLFVFAVLDVCCWLWAFSSYGEQGYSLVVVCRLFTAAFPLVWSMGSGPLGSAVHGTWDLPDPGIASLFPALSGILYHWTTREGPPAPRFLNHYIPCPVFQQLRAPYCIFQCVRIKAP